MKDFLDKFIVYFGAAAILTACAALMIAPAVIACYSGNIWWVLLTLPVFAAIAAFFESVKP